MQNALGCLGKIPRLKYENLVDKRGFLGYIYTCHIVAYFLRKKRGRIMSKELIRLQDLLMEFDG